MPREARLLLEEQDPRGVARRGARGQLIVHGDGDSQTRGAEAHAEEVVHIGRVGGVEEGGFLDGVPARVVVRLLGGAAVDSIFGGGLDGVPVGLRFVGFYVAVPVGVAVGVTVRLRLDAIDVSLPA